MNEPQDTLTLQWNESFYQGLSSVSLIQLHRFEIKPLEANPVGPSLGCLGKIQVLLLLDPRFKVLDPKSKTYN